MYNRLTPGPRPGTCDNCPQYRHAIRIILDFPQYRTPVNGNTGNNGGNANDEKSERREEPLPTERDEEYTMRLLQRREADRRRRPHTAQVQGGVVVSSLP